MRYRTCSIANISKPLHRHSRLNEYLRNDVDSAHLLPYHHDTRCLRSTADPRNGEKFNEAREEVLRLCQSGLLDHAVLCIKLRLDVVDVSCCLKRRVAKSEQRLVSIVWLLLLEVPSWRFRAEVDADDCTSEE